MSVAPTVLLLGAPYSGRSLTPARGDLAPAATRLELQRFARWDASTRTDLSDQIVDHGDVVCEGHASLNELPWDEVRAAIEAHAERVWSLATGSSQSGHEPLVLALGGDHSVAWPLVTAACTALAPARVGIIQIDVHHDVRPLTDGPSNGTPIRGLLEEGIVRGTDVVQIGIHPFANQRELTTYCADSGILTFSLDDVRVRGTSAVVDAALKTLAHCDAIYLTVDIDVLDRAYAPGTVGSMPGGLTPGELSEIVRSVCHDPRTRAMDVVEFDASSDVAQITARNVAQVVCCATATVVRRAG